MAVCRVHLPFTTHCFISRKRKSGEGDVTNRKILFFLLKRKDVKSDFANASMAVFVICYIYFHCSLASYNRCSLGMLSAVLQIAVNSFSIIS